MKAINIIWDADDPEDLEGLPTEIEIPEGMTDEEAISDYLSDITGFCHKGFCLDNECRHFKCSDCDHSSSVAKEG